MTDAPRPTEDPGGSGAASPDASKPTAPAAPQPPPYGSIIERYRGTQWQSPEPLRPPLRPHREPPIVLIAVLLLVVGGLGAAVWLAQSRPPSGPDILPPGPQVTARVPDSIRILDRFWSVVRAPDFSYHLEATTEAMSAPSGSAVPSIDRTFTLSLDVAGDDFQGTSGGGESGGVSDIVRVDGVVYVRPPGGDWIFVRTRFEPLRQVPFAGLEGRRELAYDAALTEGGQVRHRLVTTDFYAPSVARMLAIADFPLHPDSVRLEVIVDDNGVPLRATFTCVVKESLVDAIPPFQGSATYVYTNVGEHVDVVAPVP